MSGEPALVTAHRLHLGRLVVFALLLSVATGVAGVALTAAAWSIAYSAGVLTGLQELISRSSTFPTFDVYSVLGFRPVLGLATVLAVAGLVWMPFLAALLGVVFNATARLVGNPVYTVRVAEDRRSTGPPRP